MREVDPAAAEIVATVDNVTRDTAPVIPVTDAVVAAAAAEIVIGETTVTITVKGAALATVETDLHTITLMKL